MKGRSTSGTTGFGTVEVSGRSRVPSPPARITACIRALLPGSGHARCPPLPARRSPPAYPLVDEARGADAVGVERVAPVDDQVTAHPPRDLVPLELHELLPLGDEDGR